MPWAVRLSWLEMPIHAHFLGRAILTRKIGRTDLAFGVQSGFTSRSTHARLQVSVCSGYDLCHPGLHTQLGCGKPAHVRPSATN